MPVDPLSRYRSVPTLQVTHATRGTTRSLAIRRAPPPDTDSGRTHRMASYDTVDLIAKKYYGHEELYWAILDANGQRAPESFQPGEKLTISPLSQVTRVERPL